MNTRFRSTSCRRREVRITTITTTTTTAASTSIINRNRTAMLSNSCNNERFRLTALWTATIWYFRNFLNVVTTRTALLLIILVTNNKIPRADSFTTTISLVPSASLYLEEISKQFHNQKQHRNCLFAVASSSNPQKDVFDRKNASNGNTTDMERYRQEAMKIRLEAEKMDLLLTLQKIETIQNSISKLRKKQQQQQSDDKSDSNSTTLTKRRNGNHTESIEQLEQQIRILQKKVKTITLSPIMAEANQLETSDIEMLPPSGSTARTGTGTSGTFIATAPTIGNSDVPLVVTIDNKSDRIMVSSNGSTLTTSDSIAAMTTTKSSSTMTTTTTIITNTNNKMLSNSVVVSTPLTNTDLDPSYPTKSQQSFNVTTGGNTCLIQGFEKADLDLYLPVAYEIDRTMKNATIEEKLLAFRSSPNLQQHFKDKLKQLFIEPITEMSRLDELRMQYLDSTSSKEKDLLKRQMDRITKSIETDGPFTFSDSVYYPISKLSDEEINQRAMDIEALPELLQIIYKQRYNLPNNANFTLAILLDHYEMQLQLLEQIKELPKPFTADIRNDIVQAIKSLPNIVLDHVMTVIGLNPEKSTIDDLIVELSKNTDGVGGKDDESDKWWANIVTNLPSSVTSTSSKKSFAALDWSVLDNISTMDDESNDIEMIDRSRYVYDLYPSIARMENDNERITPETVELLSRRLLDTKKTFMVTNKVERVVGGYYIRGRNLVDEDGSGVLLMKQLESTISSATRNGSLPLDENLFEYFYIRDPAPLTDEEIEQEYRNDPVFVIIRRNRERFYNDIAPVTKFIISLSSILTMGIFAMDSLNLGENFLGNFQAFINKPPAVDNNGIDLSLLFSNLGHVIVPIIAVQLVHEIGHHIVAWKDKFDIGAPTFIPSMQLGCTGTITQFSSPPPNLKAMFDFGMSGPALGLIASLALLVDGLHLTSSMDLNQLSTLPSLPTYIVRSSTLGSALVEWFLGSCIILPDTLSFLPLHPFAVAGYVGMISNALALLPLGRTDGGRIAISMFGRRGAILVKTLVAAVLCAAGLFGLDDSGLLLNYVIIILLWQNELETPARNEVEELDFGRGAIGIASAALVIMILLPLQS